MATTRLVLEQLLNESIGDTLEFDTTANIGASATTVVSNDLWNFDGGQDDYFNGWWLSFQEGINAAAVPRQISDYSTAGTAKLYIRTALSATAESGAVTLRLHRFNPNNKWTALNRSLEQLYPILYKPIDNQILVTGNILPNAHFEDWASTAIPDFYASTAAGTATVASSAITTAGLFRGGGKSVKVTPTAANGYMYVGASNYPSLLDLSGKSVSFYVWAYPEVANDPKITIYTANIAGSTQTLSSTTAASSAQWSLLKLENQTLNDNLVDCQFRFIVASSTKYVYYDDAIACGMPLKEYPIPSALQDGVISKVMIQFQGYSSTTIPKAGYDIQPRYWGAPEGFNVIQEGDYLSSGSPPVYKRLQLYDFPNNYYRMRLIGSAPIPTMSADTATIYLDGERLNLVIAKATAILYGMEQGPVSSQDKGRYYNEIARAENEVRKLIPHLGMIRPSSIINTGE